MALEELGTTFVKMGQILSTRTDILPSDYAQEFVKLQSSLKPLPLDVVEKVIKDELARPVGELFASHLTPIHWGLPLSVKLTQLHFETVPKWL